MELREAINKIVNQFGKKIISEQRFIYMLADYYSFRDNPAEKHVLSAILNDGYATELLRNDLGSELVNKMRCDICRCYGYRDDLVKDVLESLLKGLMISFLPESNNMDSSYFMGNSVVTNFKSNDIQFFLKRTMVFRGKEYVLCDAYGYYNDSEGSFVIKGGSLLAIQDFYIHLVLGSEIVIENQEIKYNRENNKNKKRFKKIDIIFLMMLIEMLIIKHVRGVTTPKTTGGLIENIYGLNHTAWVRLLKQLILVVRGLEAIQCTYGVVMAISMVLISIIIATTFLALLI